MARKLTKLEAKIMKAAEVPGRPLPLRGEGIGPSPLPVLPDLAGVVEVRSLRKRHDALAREMIRRGYRHDSPLPEFPSVKKGGEVDRSASLRELLRRCPECRRNLMVQK